MAINRPRFQAVFHHRAIAAVQRMFKAAAAALAAAKRPTNGRSRCLLGRLIRDNVSLPRRKPGLMQFIEKFCDPFNARDRFRFQRSKDG